MADIVSSLFGITPESYQQNQQAMADAQALQYAKLSPFEQANYAVGRGATMLGNAVGGALGGQDPELARISARQQIAKQINYSDPKSITKGVEMLSQIGDVQGAMMLADRARGLQESASKIALQNAQLYKALQPPKLTGDERYIADLRTVENKIAGGETPTETEISNANMAGQMLSKPRSFFDQASGQTVTIPATDPSKAFPKTYKLIGAEQEAGGTTTPKPTVQQATAGNLPAGSQKDIAEIDASLEKIANSTQLEALSKSLKTGDVKFNAASNAFDFLGAVVPPVFGGQEVGNQVKKDEFTRAITERVNFVLNSAKGVQAKDDAQRAKDQIASPSTFYSSARMQGAIDSLIKAENSLKQELLAKKTALQSQGRTEAPGVPSAKPSVTQPSATQPTEAKPSPKPTQNATQMTREQKIDAVIRFNANKGVTVSPQQAEKALRDAGKL